MLSKHRILVPLETQQKSSETSISRSPYLQSPPKVMRSYKRASTASAKKRSKHRLSSVRSSSSSGSEGHDSTKHRRSASEVERAHFRTVERIKEKLAQTRKEQKCEREKKREIERQRLVRLEKQEHELERSRRKARQRVESVASQHDGKEERVKVAICGAGPVGLFLAVALRLKYGVLKYSWKHSMWSFVAKPMCPSIQIFEKRSLENWGTRTQTISIQSSVQALLTRLLPEPNNFSPTCPINLIENRLRDFVEGPLGIRIHEEEIEENRTLIERGFDAIVWAGGKNSPPQDIRDHLDLTVSQGPAENALIFDFNVLKNNDSECNGDAIGVLAENVHRALISDALRVLVRPPLNEKSQGLLWIIGLNRDLFEKVLQVDSDKPYESMEKAVLASILTSGAKAKKDSQVRTLLQIVRLLEERSGPMPCHLSKLKASHFKSGGVYAEVDGKQYESGEESSSVPLLLVGDAAFGKPFYTGSTLNNHLQDAYMLAMRTDWTRSNIRESKRVAFDAYLRNFQHRVSAPRFACK